MFMITLSDELNFDLIVYCDCYFIWYVRTDLGLTNFAKPCGRYSLMEKTAKSSMYSGYICE